MSRSTTQCSLVLALLAAASACAGPHTANSKSPKTRAATEQASQQRTELERVFAKIFEVSDDDRIPQRLRQPQSPQDAQDIVRSDNVALFEHADQFFVHYLQQHADDLDNLTWHAQLYLVWADSAQLTSKTLSTSIGRLQKQQQRLADKIASGDLGETERATSQARVDELRWLIPLTQKIGDKLSHSAHQKLQIAEAKTLAIRQTHPDSYQAYRLGADLARLQEDWGAFDANLDKLDQLNPDSNGLRFLRGVVAFARDHDYALAVKLLAQAVETDPRFTKAQYYLALAELNQRHFGEAQDALHKTLQMSPGHPFASAVLGYLKRAHY